MERCLARSGCVRGSGLWQRTDTPGWERHPGIETGTGGYFFHHPVGSLWCVILMICSVPLNGPNSNAHVLCRLRVYCSNLVLYGLGFCCVVMSRDTRTQSDVMPYMDRFVLMVKQATKLDKSLLCPYFCWEWVIRLRLCFSLRSFPVMSVQWNIFYILLVPCSPTPIRP